MTADCEHVATLTAPVITQYAHRRDTRTMTVCVTCHAIIEPQEGA